MRPFAIQGPLWFAASFLLLCGGSILLPGIDLWASGLFYRPGDGFFLGAWRPFELVHDHLNLAVWAYAIAVVALGTASFARRRRVLGLTPRVAIFLLLSLALGPGLTVNTIFKDHWGRARPAQITQFGGTQKFTPAFVPSDQCRRNCSFPAGDPAMGFYLVSAAFLAGGAAARRRGIIGAVALGAALGVMRLGQGGHFLSDIIATGFIIAAIAWGLHRLILRSDAIERWARALCHPAPGLKRFAWLTLGCLLGFFVAYRWIDIKLATALQTIDPVTRAIFGFITRLGEGGVYLVPLAVLLVWTRVKRERLWTMRAAFVFIVIAVPGIVADIMKPVFARARPVLLFREHIFGFTWGSPHANAWSFPSGHSVTVAALAVALYAIYPSAWPAYALLALAVMASRIILDQHYLSDVIAGFYIGIAFAIAFVATARRHGLPLLLKSRKALLMSAPLEGIDLNRGRDPGREIDL
ncbi:MAG TPA: phosphatase PAP2 family protein [Stellaceae bacterium]|nr:phosphatase PAP2 family protein [Stellaceae bacterium]